MSPRHAASPLLMAGVLAFATSGCAAPVSPPPNAATLPPAQSKTAAPPALSAPTNATAAAPSPAPASAASPLRANVEAVDDVRSTRERAGCRVALSIFGDDLDQVAAITDTAVNQAQDDLGRSLIEPAAGTRSDYSAPVPIIRPDAPHLGLHTVLSLRNPTRNATLIKTLDLTLQLYSPTADNGAIAPIESPLPAPGTPINNAALAAQGIELVQLTPQQELELRPQFVAPNPTPEAEQRRLEAVAAEVARRRAIREAQAATMSSPVGNTSPAPSPDRVGSDAPSTAGTASAPRPQPRTVPSVTFRITDPNHRLVALQWTDATGRLVRPLMPYYTAQERLLRSYETQRAGWHLGAYIATDGSVQSRNLHLENIALP